MKGKAWIWVVVLVVIVVVVVVVAKKGPASSSSSTGKPVNAFAVTSQKGVDDALADKLTEATQRVEKAKTDSHVSERQADKAAREGKPKEEWQ